jgi:hypothetical protein
LALMLLLLVGCGTTTSPTTTGTSSTICQYIQTINQSLTTLAGIGDKTTVGEVKGAQQKLTKALDALAKLPVGNGSTLNDLRQANDQLAAAINDKPDSATVGETGPKLQQFKQNVTKAQTATTKLNSLLKCGG